MDNKEYPKVRREALRQGWIPKAVKAGEMLGQAVTTAVGRFMEAAEKAGLVVESIARVDVMDDTYMQRFLNDPPESYVGVTEIARLLGVSRQRVSELRTREDFPSPVAEL